jgi:hypothetical protein
MQQVRGFQSGGSVSEPLLVDQQGKGDPGFLAEKTRVPAVPQSHRGQPGSLFLEGFLVLAQLRDVFTTENSAVVPQENEHRRTARPQGPENDFPSIAIRKSDLGQLGAKHLFHDLSVWSRASLGVKPCGQQPFLNTFRMSPKAIILNDIRPFFCDWAHFTCTVSERAAKASHQQPSAEWLATGQHL